MTIQSISPSFNTMKVQNSIDFAVLDKSLATVEESGDSMVKMMERSMLEKSVNPDIGRNIDVFL